MAAEPSPAAGAAEVPTSQIEEIVRDYLLAQLESKGHRWTPEPVAHVAMEEADQVDGHVVAAPLLDTATRKKIKDSLTGLSAQLLNEYGDRISDMCVQLQPPTPASNMGYASFHSIAESLFSEGFQWSHILTILVFGAELAYSAGVVKGSPEFVDDVSSWLTRYLSTPDIVSWINGQGGWEGLIAYATSRLDHQAGQRNAEWSSRLLVGLGGALGMVMAGLYFK